MKQLINYDTQPRKKVKQYTDTFDLMMTIT